MSSLAADLPVKPYAPNINFTPDVWIDANDQAVGSLSNGTTIVNKGNGGFNFTVGGTGLSVAVNAEGKKAFVFTGAQTITAAVGNKSYFQKYNSYASSYTVAFIGKIGTTSNPDAVYGVCGNCAGSSLNRGFFILTENRVAQPATKGINYTVTKGVGGSLPISSFRYTTSLKYGQRTAIHSALNLGLVKDYHRFFIDGELFSVGDATRTTNNTTSGLGTIVGAASSDPTYDFQIGSVGNNALYFTGEVEQFLIFSPANPYIVESARGLEKHFRHYVTPGHTDKRFITTIQTISDGYVLGGFYHKYANRSKTTWLTSKGPDHFAVGSDREGVQVVSTDDGWHFPTSYSSVFVDATTSIQGGFGGGILPSTKAIVTYGKYTTATGAYIGMFYRTSADLETWSSETSITLPSTSPALTAYVTCDIGVLADNGDMMIPWYGLSGTSLYNVYVMRVSSDGTVFAHKLVYTSGSTYKNECSLVNLGSSRWALAVRVEAAANTATSYVTEYFYSSDDCETWSSLGTTNYGIRQYVYPHPPMIRTFLINGTQVLAAYFVDRGERRWYVTYVTAAAFIASGISAFNKTVYHLDIRLLGDNQGWESGYPNVIHPDNALFAEGVYFQETSTSVSSTTFFKIKEGHKAKIIAELGL